MLMLMISVGNKLLNAVKKVTSQEIRGHMLLLEMALLFEGSLMPRVPMSVMQQTEPVSLRTELKMAQNKALFLL